ncbi:5648_t:CDS:2, partial [Racocetra persica]
TGRRIPLHDWKSIKGQIKNKRSFNKGLNINYNLTATKPKQGNFIAMYTTQNPQNPSNQYLWILFIHNRYISAEAQADVQYYKIREEAAINQFFEVGGWTDLKEKLPKGRHPRENYFFQLQFTEVPILFETAFEALE